MHPKPIDTGGVTVLPERFMSKIVRDSNGCWNWTANTDYGGYGHFKWGPRTVLAHRFAYTVLVGPIPDRLQLDHLCRNRGCANPDHLEPVTCRENLLRGETVNAAAIAKTHCPNGHDYTADNTYWRNGHRNCRECSRAKSRRRMARIRAANIAAGLTSKGKVRRVRAPGR